MPNFGSFKNMPLIARICYKLKITDLYEKVEDDRTIKSGYLNQYNPLTWVVVLMLCCVMVWEVAFKGSKFESYHFKELFVSKNKMKSQGFRKL